MRWSVRLILLIACAGAARADGPAGRVTFMRDGGVYVLDLASGHEREVIKGLSEDRPIEWSPDGGEILYWKHGEWGWDLWAVGTDGKGARNLTKVEKGGARSGAWSPDGSRVAYMRDSPQGLYVVGRDGTGARRLTHDGFRDERPAWSPDGKWLVYQEFDFVDESARADAKFKLELYAIQADGAGKRKVTASEGSSDSASFSSKGELVYRGVRGGNGEICVMDAIGGKERVLTRTPAEEHAPSWSPDGASIAFWRDATNEHELWIMNADGAGQKKLAGAKSGLRVDRAHWSPDAKWLVFGGTDAGDGVWILSSGGGEPKHLPRGAGAWARWEPAKQQK
jgi:TolB protein